MRTRFAPSPTGPLHLGHAYSAILAHDMALAAGGEFLLRIEDIDQSRARPEWEEQIYDDLAWLGLSWETAVMRQSERMEVYARALKTLWDEHILFACTCNRRDVLEAASAPQDGPAVYGPDGIIYPGTCNTSANKTGCGDWPVPTDTALRLDMSMAAERVFHHRIARAEAGWQWLGSFTEQGSGPKGESGLIEFTSESMQQDIGDVVLARRDMGTSYHLSVVLDDAAQKITDVVRGEDLFEATKIHVVLQRLLGLASPTYHHHALIRDESGKRLAKRDDARSIATYRDDGASPADIRAMVGL
ncbi:MAG: tRNA glutamyl-Q(34) synthetase GluQRS [Paracoccaceae bacterium]